MLSDSPASTISPTVATRPATLETTEERVLGDITQSRRQEDTRISGKDADGRTLVARVFTTDSLGLVHFDVMERTPDAWTIVTERSALGSTIPEAHRTLRLEESHERDAGPGAPRVPARDGGPRVTRYWEITGGPLAGGIAWETPGRAGFAIKSIPWIHLHNDHAIGAWLCHDHRIAGKDPKLPADLVKTCQEGVLDKLTSRKAVDWSPPGTTKHEPQTFADCTQSWTSWVEFEVPWGRWRRRFTCSYDPVRGRPVIFLE